MPDRDMIQPSAPQAAITDSTPKRKVGQCARMLPPTEAGSMRAIMQPISPWASTKTQDGTSIRPPAAVTAIPVTIGPRNSAAGMPSQKSTALSATETATSRVHCAAGGILSSGVNAFRSRRQI
jgi:hypothetical protein